MFRKAPPVAKPSMTMPGAASRNIESHWGMQSGNKIAAYLTAIKRNYRNNT